LGSRQEKGAASLLRGDLGPATGARGFRRSLWPVRVKTTLSLDFVDATGTIAARIMRFSKRQSEFRRGSARGSRTLGSPAEAARSDEEGSTIGMAARGLLQGHDGHVIEADDRAAVSWRGVVRSSLSWSVKGNVVGSSCRSGHLHRALRVAPQASSSPNRANA